MKFIVDSAALNKALKTVAPAVEVNTVLPILKSVKLDVNKNVLNVTASNIGLTVSVVLECETGEKKPFSVILGHKEIFNITSVIAAQPLTIEVNDGQILTSSLGEKYKMGKSEDTDTFPALPEFEELISIEAEPRLLEAIQLAKNTCAPTVKGADIVFTEVLLHIEGGHTKVVSTDKEVFYKYSENNKTKTNYQGLLSQEFIRSINGLENVTFSGGERFISAKSKNTTVVGRMIDMKFPQYENFFQDYSYNATINKKMLLSAIEKAMVYDDRIYELNFYFDKKDRIDIQFLDYVLERNAESYIETKHSVKPPKGFIPFGGLSLKKGLALLPDGDVKISFAENICHFDSEDDTTKVIVMPYAAKS